jgi:hypothetical protein
MSVIALSVRLDRFLSAETARDALFFARMQRPLTDFLGPIILGNGSGAAELSSCVRNVPK